MDHRFSRRDVLVAGGVVGAGCSLGLWTPVLGQQLHTPAAGLDRWHRGVCGLCGLSDPLYTGFQDGHLLSVKGDPSSPGSRGRLCPRGMAFPAGLTDDRRPATPLLRKDPATRGTLQGLEPTSWEEAATFIRQHVGDVARKTPAALATFVDHSLPCETHWTLNKLLRGVLGCANLESDLRLDSMAGIVAAEQALGHCGPTGSLDNMDTADLFVVVGADPAERHSTLYYRMMACHRRSSTPLVLIDTRRTLTAGLADVFVRPKVPGTEPLILQAIANALLRDEMVDRVSVADIPGFDEFAAHLAAVTPAAAAEASGAKEADIEAAAQAFADSASTFSCYGTGLTAHGSQAVASLYDLHTLRGGEGSTVVPLLEGSNALGALLMGSASDRLPGLRSLDKAGDRKAMAQLWSVPEQRLANGSGMPLGDWLGALEWGTLETLVMFGGNLLPRLPDNRRWRAALGKTKVISVTPFAPTESTVFADLVLPIAYSPTEERGCSINLERRIQLTDPPQAPVLPTSLDVALRLAAACTESADHETLFAPYEKFGPERVWEDIRAATAGQLCDLSGASYASLAEHGHQAWPCPEGAANEEQTPVLAPTAVRFVSSIPRSSSPGTSSRPFALMVVSDSHHSGARELTGFVPELHYAAPRCWIEISGRDASRNKLSDGAWTAVESDSGLLIARLWITDRVPRGVVAIPGHFGFLGDMEGGTDGRAEPESLAGNLLPSSFDTPSGQPLLTGVRVTLRAPTEQEQAVRALATKS